MSLFPLSTKYSLLAHVMEVAFSISECLCVVGGGHVSIADGVVCVCVWVYLCAGVLNWKWSFIRLLAKSSPLPS